MEKITAEIWQCTVEIEDWDKESYEGCCPETKFKAVRQQDVEVHETGHLNFIRIRKQQRELAACSEAVIAAEICVGTFADWSELLQLAKLLAHVVHRQPLMGGQSVGTFDSGMGVEFSLRDLLWLQMKEGQTVNGQKWYKGGWRAIEALLNEIHREADGNRNDGKFAKPATEHLPELSGLIDKIDAEMKGLRGKFPKAEGFPKVRKAIESARYWISNDLKQITPTEGDRKIA